MKKRLCSSLEAVLNVVLIENVPRQKETLSFSFTEITLTFIRNSVGEIRLAFVT